jgi:uncharacterized membrane protein
MRENASSVGRSTLLSLVRRVISSKHVRRMCSGSIKEQARVALEECAAMSDLVVIVYPTEAKAEEMRQKILGLQKEYLIEVGDAVIAVKHADGTVKLNQLFSTTAAGTATGGLWGLLVGLVFLNPILGVALGAASGALAGAMSDYGINDEFMKQLSGSLQPGNAALFLLIKKFTADKVLEAMKGTGGTILKTSLDDSKEKALREAISAHT